MDAKLRHKTNGPERIPKVELKKIFSKPGLYPVISSGFTKNRPLHSILEELASVGIDLVQLRLKEVPVRQMLNIADSFREICGKYKIALIINDRADIALACDAEGVHLGQDDLAPSRVANFAEQLFIGVSTHSLKEAFDAENSKADYINIGPIFQTNTKKTQCAPLGTKIIAEIAKKIKIPFTVMGGIKSAQIPELLEAGAKRIAMVTEICEADNVQKKILDLNKLFK